MKRKKIIALVSALCMMCAAVPVNTAIRANAERYTISDTETYEDFAYQVTANNTIEIMGYCDSEVTEAVIPSEINGLPVTSIHAGAFKNWFGEYPELKSVTLPEGLVSIGENAFSGVHLTEITIPESVTKIGTGAFSETDLTSVTVPAGVESLKNTFQKCENLTDITIMNPLCRPDSIVTTTNVVIHSYETSAARGYVMTQQGKLRFESIGETPAEEMVKFLEYTVTDDNTIQITGYDGNNGGTLVRESGYIGGSVVIPSEIDGLPVTSVGRMAFRYHSGVTSVTVPDSVTEIGSQAFANCPKLESVVLSANLTVIETETFLNASALTAVDIPGSVKTIETRAFGYTGLTAVDIPKGVTEIRERAFASSKELKEITIPSTASMVHYTAFEGCNALEKVTILRPDYVYPVVNPDTTVYGYTNSPAQKFCEKNGMTFVSLGNAPGDANTDGAIDILDVIQLNKAIFGKSTLDDDQSKAVDVNGNGTPDSTDALNIMKYIIKLIDCLD